MGEPKKGGMKIKMKNENKNKEIIAVDHEEQE